MSGTWQERLAAFEAEWARELPGEECRRFAAYVADHLKGVARRSPDEAEAAFQDALERLVEVIEQGPPQSP